MPRNQAYEKKFEIDVDSTGVTYSPVFDFSWYDQARQLEIKADVQAGDGSIDFEAECSDDGVTRFTVEDTDFTVAAVAKKGIFFDAVGNFMRVKIDYTHNTTATTGELFVLVR